MQYGWTADQRTDLNDALTLGRVIAQSRNLYTVQTAETQVQAQVTGRFMNRAVVPTDYPAVGDWVQLQLRDPAATSGMIEVLLPRTSVFTRKAAGTSSLRQVVAANVDTVCICMALDGNFNVRRLERYMAVARDSSAQPCVVLTKADLAQNLAQQLTDVALVAGDAQVLVCDATRADGWQELTAILQPQ